MLKKRIHYLITAILYAFFIFWMTQELFWSVARGDVFVGTIINMVYIVVALFMDRLETYLHIKMQNKYKEKKLNILQRIIMAYIGGASFKSALYLYYFLMLICFALVGANPEFPVLRYMGGYFQSIEYGILILFAGDTFLARLFKEADGSQ